MVVNGLLYKKNAANKLCLVVPLSLRKQALSMCHNDMGGGHLGFKKTWPKVYDRFYSKNNA